MTGKLSSYEYANQQPSLPKCIEVGRKAQRLGEWIAQIIISPTSAEHPNVKSRVKI